MQLEYWQIIVLAVIQGAAELLPVSSSAHVILAEKWMGFNDPSKPELTFLLVMLHTGTMIAVLVYFWRRWKALLVPRADHPSRPSMKHFILAILVASAATAIIGGGLILFIEEIVFKRILGKTGEVEQLFKNLPLIGTALLAAGAVILWAGYREDRGGKRPLTWATALWIGLIQGLCLPFRGFSRSGATISTGMLRGVPRALSEDFSFALAVVLTPAAIVWEGRRLLNSKNAAEWRSHVDLLALLTPGLIGMVLSCLAGLIALWFLSAMLEKGRWRYFGYYCIVAALVVYAAALRGW